MNRPSLIIGLLGTVASIGACASASKPQGAAGTGGAPGTGGASSTGGGAGTGASVTTGCTASNTMVAPAAGVIATFTGADGGVDILGTVYAHTPPTSYTTDGTLHMTINGPVMVSSLPIDVVVDHFANCIDATQFSGVQFLINGSLSGCTLGFFAEDSPHLYDSGQPSGSHGGGPSGSHPTFTVLKTAQVTSAPQTVMIPFAALAAGFPATPVDKAKLTGVGWVFFADPFTDGGAGSCVVDVTIDDVRFF